MNGLTKGSNYMKIRRKVFKSKEHNECTKELKKERML